MSFKCVLVLFLLKLVSITYVVTGGAVQDYSADQGKLPAECYSPSGNTCDWYRQCFEKQFPCEHTSHPYAIGFAEHYCQEFSKMYKKFTSDGKTWIDAVRKCLQVDLVPLIKNNKAMTCKDIQTYAFKSHVPCYHTPESSQPKISFCRLPFVDWLRVTYTIKTSFLKVPLASVHGVLGTLTKCMAKGK